MSGEQLKNEGMEQTLRKEHEDWKVAYGMVAQALIASFEKGKHFTGTDVNEYVKTIIGEPHTPKVWSAMFWTFIRPYLSGNIVVWDGFVKSTKPSDHSRWNKQYKKV